MFHFKDHWKYYYYYRMAIRINTFLQIMLFSNSTMLWLAHVSYNMQLLLAKEGMIPGPLTLWIPVCTCFPWAINENRQVGLATLVKNWETDEKMALAPLFLFPINLSRWLSYSVCCCRYLVNFTGSWKVLS